MIHCKQCHDEIPPLVALESSSVSWPLLQTIWYECRKCKTGNHIRFQNQQIQRIEIIGAPCPEWEVVERERDKAISYRVDPSYLHIWYNDTHYEFAENK